MTQSASSDPSTSPVAAACPAEGASGPGVRRSVGRIPAVGFATAVAMWALAYVAFMGPGLLAGEVLFLLMLGVLVAGGVVAGRTAPVNPSGGRRGLRDGLACGAVSAAVNMLLIGSLLGGEDGSTGAGTVAGWIGGLWLVSLTLSGLGGAFGARSAVKPCPRHWPGVFAAVAVVTVFLLLITGGLVTGLEAGLAVPDWPNSFGHNMLLYPLSEMTGGVYYEHAHRLYGMLVGLTTLMLAILIWISDRRSWVRWTAGAALLMVCVQGVMGGLRVTGRLTTSAEAADLAPNLGLAIAHGVFGQVVFATLAVLAAATSTTWVSAQPRLDRVTAGGDRIGSTMLVGALLIQLILGACYRHLQAPGEQPMWALHGHLTMAVVVVSLAIFVGLRAWGLYADVPILKRLGVLLLALIAIQFCLGIGALVAVLFRQDGDAIPVLEVIITSAHQATGAAVLAVAALLAAWSRRLLIDSPSRR